MHNLIGTMMLGASLVLTGSASVQVAEGAPHALMISHPGEVSSLIEDAAGPE